MLGLYCRVSGLEQERGETVEGQIRRAIEYAERCGADYRLYQPAGHESASAEDLADRPSLRRLLEDVKEGTITEVWTRELARLSRKDETKAEIYRVFRKHKIKIHEDGGAIYDFDNPSSELQADVIFIFAKFEAAMIRARMGGGLRDLRAEGKMPHAWLYGYRQGPKSEKTGAKKGQKTRRLISTWIPVQHQLDTIRCMYDLLLGGASLNQIARHLIDHGLMSRAELDARGTKLRRLFSRLEYTGHTWGDFIGGKMVPSYHYPVAVVSLEEWRRAQSIIKAKKVERQVRYSGHVCSGLLKCAMCGQLYHFYQSKVNGRRFSYYKHQEATWVPKCGQKPKNLPVDYLHMMTECLYLYSMTSREDVALISEQVQAAIKSKQSEITAAVGRLEEQEREIVRRIDNIREVIQAGGDADVLAVDLNSLSRKRKELQQLVAERKRELLDGSQSLSDLIVRTSVERVTAWSAASPPERRVLLRELLRGRVYNGMIIISTWTNRHYVFSARRTAVPPELAVVMTKAPEIAKRGLATPAEAGVTLLDLEAEKAFEAKFRVSSLAQFLPPELLSFPQHPIPPKFFDLRPQEVRTRPAGRHGGQA